MSVDATGIFIEYMFDILEVKQDFYRYRWNKINVKLFESIDKISKSVITINAIKRLAATNIRISGL